MRKRGWGTDGWGSGVRDRGGDRGGLNGEWCEGERRGEGLMHGGSWVRERGGGMAG